MASVVRSSFLLVSYFFSWLPAWQCIYLLSITLAGWAFASLASTESLDAHVQYIYAVYWAYATMTTVGYGDVYGELNNRRVSFKG